MNNDDYIYYLLKEVKVEVKVAQSCSTLCNLMDYTVHGILQARILEWVAVPFSRGSSQPGMEPKSPVLQAGYHLCHQGSLGVTTKWEGYHSHRDPPEG